MQMAASAPHLLITLLGPRLGPMIPPVCVCVCVCVEGGGGGEPGTCVFHTHSELIFFISVIIKKSHLC